MNIHIDKEIIIIFTIMFIYIAISVICIIFAVAQPQSVPITNQTQHDNFPYWNNFPAWIPFSS